MLGAVGTHLIDLVAFVTGERATTVHCRLSTHVTERAAVDGAGPEAGKRGGKGRPRRGRDSVDGRRADEDA